MSVVPTAGNGDAFLVSEQGMVMHFDESNVRAMGRGAAGVRGMKLRSDDHVVACDVAKEGADLFVGSSAGYGKRTKLGQFGVHARGGLGVRGMRITGKRGTVVDAIMVTPKDELLIVSSAGTVIRTEVSQITAQGRDATGVRVMNLGKDEQVVAVAILDGFE